MCDAGVVGYGLTRYPRLDLSSPAWPVIPGLTGDLNSILSIKTGDFMDKAIEKSPTSIKEAVFMEVEGKKSSTSKKMGLFMDNIQLNI